MDNKGYDDIEMQDTAGNSRDEGSGNNEYEYVANAGGSMEKPSLSDSDSHHDDDSIVADKKAQKEIEIDFKQHDFEELEHDGPYAGMGKEELLRYSSGASWRAARWFLLILILAGWCTMLAMSIYIIVVTPRCLPWWQTSVIYQIYPRSFKDSNDDGIGDLNGIRDNVDYLKELGVGAVLLNSIYQSPQEDFGYDVTDFETVDETFGSQDDFEALVEALHNQNIKLILDFVPNHSSNLHKYFNASADGDGYYLKWYTWADVKYNNWLSTYSGEAWHQDLGRIQHYLHQFSVHQPDFNLREEAVIVYLENVLENWFIKGVDGFSITGVKYMFETDDFESDDLPNTAYVDDGLGLPLQYDSLIHDKSSEFDGEQHNLLKRWRKGIFDQFSTAGTYRIMLSDSDSNSTYARTYYGTADDDEVDLPMNFNLLELGDVNGGMSDDTKGTAYTTGDEVYNLVKDWIDNLPGGKWPTFMLGHHGVRRIASRLSPDYAAAANLLLLTLPGTPICYYGDELGLVDATIERDQVKDIKAKIDMDRWQTKTRDPQRAPMPWNTAAYGGFTAFENGTWLPMAEYDEVNVDTLKGDANSVLNMFKELTKLRAERMVLRQGLGVVFVKNTVNVISYIREMDGEAERFFVAINFGQDMSFENDFFAAANGDLPVEGTILVSTDMKRNMERVQLNKIALGAGEGMIVLLDEIVEVGNNWLYQYFRPAA